MIWFFDFQRVLAPATVFAKGMHQVFRRNTKGKCVPSGDAELLLMSRSWVHPAAWCSWDLKTMPLKLSWAAKWCWVWRALCTPRDVKDHRVSFQSGNLWHRRQRSPAILHWNSLQGHCFGYCGRAYYELLGVSLINFLCYAMASSILNILPK